MFQNLFYPSGNSTFDKVRVWPYTNEEKIFFSQHRFSITGVVGNMYLIVEELSIKTDFF